MATLDLIQSFGGEPANFLDVRAGATASQIEKALRIVSSNKNVKAILVNIFGGLTRCDEIATGISKILPEVNLPIVVRLSGTREEEGKRILMGARVVMADTTEEAARKVVGLI
jgi:succinyl-CoA synthetase beta subunit